jgi:hypothetical protein
MATKVEPPQVPDQRRPGAPPAHRRIELPDREIELHEMPDITKLTPEVEYARPEARRMWLWYVAAGAVAVLALGIGLWFGLTAPPSAYELYGDQPYLRPDAPVALTADYSLAREHVAQTPGGFPTSVYELYGGQPYVRPDSPVGTAYGLGREHLAQTPGGFPFVSTYGYGTSLAGEHLAQGPLPIEVAFADSLAMEHLAQTPGGFPD